MSVFSSVEQNLPRALWAPKGLFFPPEVCLSCLFRSADFLCEPWAPSSLVRCSLPFYHTLNVSLLNILDHSKTYFQQLPADSGIAFLKECSKGTQRHQIKLSVHQPGKPEFAADTDLTHSGWSTVVLYLNSWILSDWLVAGLGMSRIAISYPPPGRWILTPLFPSSFLDHKEK